MWKIEFTICDKLPVSSNIGKINLKKNKMYRGIQHMKLKITQVFQLAKEKKDIVIKEITDIELITGKMDKIVIIQKPFILSN
jgi:hypothetical protein